jgi:hypothetical protein
MGANGVSLVESLGDSRDVNAVPSDNVSAMEVASRVLVAAGDGAGTGWTAELSDTSVERPPSEQAEAMSKSVLSVKRILT